MYFIFCFIQMMNNSKRACSSKSDMNNNEIVSSTPKEAKKKKSIIISKEKQSYTIGQIKELHMLNFMCHKNFSIKFHPTSMQIVTGANGSGIKQKVYLVILLSDYVLRKINNSKCNMSLFGCSSKNDRSNDECSIIYS
jgi:hypothetical protein